MKRIFFLAGILAMLLGIISCGSEKSVELTSPDTSGLKKAGAQSYSDYQGVAAPAVSNEVVSQQQITAPANFTVYTDEASFTTRNSTMQLATFNNTHVPPNSIGFSRAINSNTNNESYSPGAIPDGISVEALGSEVNVVLTTGFLGLPSTVVGPNFFAADMNIKFNPAVDLIGMQLYDPFGPALMAIDFFAPGDVYIGTISGILTGTTVPSFLGIRASGITVSRMRFRQIAGGGGELVDNIRYGLGN
ncbi:MAG: hypothetical protein ALAOOOJD_01367 [bacterium]|nr:hypothetical protein [bacterium]